MVMAQLSFALAARLRRWPPLTLRRRLSKSGFYCAHEDSQIKIVEKRRTIVAVDDHDRRMKHC